MSIRPPAPAPPASAALAELSLIICDPIDTQSISEDVFHIINYRFSNVANLTRANARIAASAKRTTTSSTRNASLPKHLALTAPNFGQHRYRAESRSRPKTRCTHCRLHNHQRAHSASLARMRHRPGAYAFPTRVSTAHAQPPHHFSRFSARTGRDHTRQLASPSAPMPLDGTPRAWHKARASSPKR